VDADPVREPADVAAVELAALRALVEGTAQATGEDFFRLLVANLSRATGVANAFVAEFAGNAQRVRTVALWRDGRLVDNIEWDLAGTPCQVVLGGELCHYPTGVSRTFPLEVGVESYLGVPLTDESGTIMGHLAIFDARPMPTEPRLLLLFRIFAARAAAELERVHIALRLRESEQRYRDLFEEAPIAYVHEDLESRFLSANRSALRILGVRDDEVIGMVGRSLVPDTPSAQQRVQEAFAAIQRGEDRLGVVLELRRKDDGRPIWIQWWSRPDPGGQFTRTMFIDITDKMLLEQEQVRLRAQNVYLQEEIKASHDFEQIIGNSAAVQTVLGKVRRVAPTDATVLIRGETGTGKELVARAIHSASRRRERPLIKVNCAALPSNLVESELFGHERGAFTGAHTRRSGRFELADGGTLFLDEVGEIPIEIQAKLLRVLQEQEFERVGGSHSIKVDVRVIAATNRDLTQAVADRAFREDLFYRLNVFPLETPPLRERLEDLDQLVEHLLHRFASRLGRVVEGLSADSWARLRAYHWPGNIRELENVIERALILAESPQVEIDQEMLPTTAAPIAPVVLAAGGERLRDVDRSHIVAVLERTQWVIEGPQGAARVLDMHPSTLRYRMKKLGIRAPG
jgi:formate hydrogenlyase transcriptional activator